MCRHGQSLYSFSVCTFSGLSPGASRAQEDGVSSVLVTWLLTDAALWTTLDLRGTATSKQ